jgi:hypothetical protein
MPQLAHCSCCSGQSSGAGVSDLQQEVTCSNMPRFLHVIVSSRGEVLPGIIGPKPCVHPWMRQSTSSNCLCTCRCCSCLAGLHETEALLLVRVSCCVDCCAVMHLRRAWWQLSSPHSTCSGTGHLQCVPANRTGASLDLSSDPWTAASCCYFFFKQPAPVPLLACRIGNRCPDDVGACVTAPAPLPAAGCLQWAQACCLTLAWSSQ